MKYITLDLFSIHSFLLSFFTFDFRFADTCIKFNDPVKVTDEFIKIQCFLKSSGSNNSIYIDYHAFNLVRNNTTNVRPYDPLIKNSASVIALGLDTVSRLNFHRQMPLTAEFIKTHLNGIELLGYNKVADNTFPNVIPVLTGHFHEELTKSCWPTWQSVFDKCNFIWDRFRDVGHTTYFSEDAPSIGGIFSYLYRGFRKQPTDYYPRPFNSEAEEKIAFNRRKESKLCVGPRTCLQVLLNNAFKFEITMKEMLSFSFVWSSCMTHDFFNLPKLADTDVKEFLVNLYKSGVFERTILVILSDHGMRWGGVRQTYQGYFEERLPLLYIAYPDWFGQRFTTAISNLKGNAVKLTTHFDLHETLLDLTKLVSIEKESLQLRSEKLGKMKNLPRGISLFLPIPGSRTCKDAGIVDHWCTCHESESVPTTDALVKRAADFLVVHINSLISDYPRCARLQLHKITNAREEKAISQNNFESSDIGLKHFSMTIETVPGQALFESTFRYNGNTNNFTIVGAVSRTNLYGNQSSCISHFTLRLYCYCT